MTLYNFLEESSRNVDSKFKKRVQGVRGVIVANIANPSGEYPIIKSVYGSYHYCANVLMADKNLADEVFICTFYVEVGNHMPCILIVLDTNKKTNGGKKFFETIRGISLL